MSCNFLTVESFDPTARSGNRSFVYNHYLVAGVIGIMRELFVRGRVKVPKEVAEVRLWPKYTRRNPFSCPLVNHTTLTPDKALIVPLPDQQIRPPPFDASQPR